VHGSRNTGRDTPLDVHALKRVGKKGSNAYIFLFIQPPLLQPKILFGGERSETTKKSFKTEYNSGMNVCTDEEE
jgi:hypothetical protein